MNQVTAMRRRLGRVPANVWAGGLAAALIGLLAFYTDPVASILAGLAVAAVVWLVISARNDSAPFRSSADEIELIGLTELAHLLEALPDPALLIDKEGRIAGSNAAARRQLQFEAAGLFLTAILRHPDVLDAVQAAIHDGATSTVEYETPAQVEEHTRCYVAPMSWGDESAALMVFHDQTSRVNTERMRADFLANASHELRTPLASLTLLIETISGPARDNAEERDRFLKMMQVQADRMRQLINDLLSLSRIELDEHVPPSDRADMVSVAREVVDAMSAVAADRGAALRLVAPDEPARAVGERFQLAQVVQNLVDNALKYTPQGGEVVIEVGVAENREDAVTKAGRRWLEAGRVSLLTPAPVLNRSYVFVRVEDSGSGIARRFLPRLGERFFRVEREMGAEKGGTGLGLAIVKHIINRHRGGLLVESQPGRGSAFSAYVERASD
jgi:two-component system, OmpR family, phosphate regulon sensor histidine kinase PhoR